LFTFVNIIHFNWYW